MEQTKNIWSTIGCCIAFYIPINQHIDAVIIIWKEEEEEKKNEALASFGVILV